VTTSGLYTGLVTHRRFAPRTHTLRYRLFQMVVDLDEVPALARRCRLFSHNRANLFSLHDRDHGDGRQSLRDYVEGALALAGLEIGSGRVRLQCMPRILGFVFNPISVFYCHSPDGSLAAIIYEVHNTFGQRHAYVAPVRPGTGDVVRQSCDKMFHVSPFMGMEMTYDFVILPPGERVSTVVRGAGPGGAPLIHASFTGERRAFTDAQLAAMFVRYPLMTLGVVAAIHYEALKLFLKGLRLWPKPAAPAAPVTLAHS
jgi:DUF1365 family protein